MTVAIRAALHAAAAVAAVAVVVVVVVAVAMTLQQARLQPDSAFDICSVE